MTALPNRVSPVGPGVVLDAVPRWFQEERKFAMVEFGKREAFFAEACLKATFEGEALGEMSEGPGGKQGKNHEVSWERIRVGNLALWLARQSALHVELVITKEPEPGPGASAMSGRFLETIRPRNRYSGVSLTSEDVVSADRLATAIQKVPRPSPVWTATRFLWLALTEELWETRYVNLWVAIEALFGPEDRHEIGMKLRKRVAKFLNEDDKDAVIGRDMVDDGYEWRSAAVHGSRFAGLTTAKGEDLMLISEGIVLTSLRKILSDPDLLSAFCSPSRDAFLDRLTRGFPDRPRPRVRRNQKNR